MPYLSLLGSKFEISTLEFALWQSFVQKIKILKFGTKNALCGYFWARILEKLLSYLKSALSNSSICKISQKTKNV